MKTMKLFLLAILFTASLHAQNDTAYFDDGSMVIGKGGIKVSIENGNIVIDGSGINNGFKPGITAEPSTGKGDFSWRVWPDTVDWSTEDIGSIKQLVEDITKFVPVDTITRIGPGWSDLIYEVQKNGAGVTKEVFIENRGRSSALSLDVPAIYHEQDTTHKKENQ